MFKGRSCITHCCSSTDDTCITLYYRRAREGWQPCDDGSGWGTRNSRTVTTTEVFRAGRPTRARMQTVRVRACTSVGRWTLRRDVPCSPPHNLLLYCSRQRRQALNDVGPARPLAICTALFVTPRRMMWNKEKTPATLQYIPKPFCSPAFLYVRRNMKTDFHSIWKWKRSFINNLIRIFVWNR